MLSDRVTPVSMFKKYNVDFFAVLSVSENDRTRTVWPSRDQSAGGSRNSVSDLIAVRTAPVFRSKSRSSPLLGPRGKSATRRRPSGEIAVDAMPLSGEFIGVAV